VKKPKTYSADSYRKKDLQNAQKQRIKEGYYRYQEKAIYESHENKLVYTYVLKDIQNIYKIEARP
jgi:GH25 family lysozyme M1 (1,4-beta-N-acetylmuramidase)